MKQTEPFRVSSNHWRMRLGLFRERITRAQLRSLLLDQPDPIVHGRLCCWKTKHLGVGVYELWAAEKRRGGRV